MNEPQDAGSGSPDGAMSALPAGEQLRVAREAKGATLADIAAQTRVPVRLLEALERGDVAALPAGPYAAGFARSYARAVGLDENAIATEMRSLQQASFSGVQSATDHYEPADADRVPPRALAWAAAAIALLLAIAYTVWRSFAMSPDTPAVSVAPAAATQGQGAPTATPVTAPVAADAPVIIRATGEVWFGLNDANGRMPFEKTLKAGESYAVPADQRTLTLRTSRPQSLRIIVGNRELPQLGPDDLLVKNVALDAPTLAARASAPVPPANGGQAAPTVPAAAPTR